MNPTLFPKTAEIFSTEWMQTIVDQNMGKPNLLNNDIFVTHELPRPEVINSWHFDRIHTLKFYFYLCDARLDNGVMEFVPKSHKLGHELAQRHIQNGGRIVDTPNRDLKPEMVKNAIPLETNAGSLIIFDTDGFHKGGIVQKGQERLVMRGHSHTDPMPLYES